MRQDERPMPRPVALLVNPSAGGGRALKALPAVEAELRRLGVPFRVERTESLLHACALAAEAVALDEVVVPFSGDGLVGAVAGVLRGREEAVMGVIPGGRGNDFARVCEIPLDPVAACAVLATGEVRPVDVGEVSGTHGAGRVFVGIASLGFDSDANRIANEAPARLGRLVYVYGAMRALAAWQPAAFALTLDGEPLSATGYSVAACNSGRYGGGMQLAPDARLDDGLLDIVMIGMHSKRRFLTMLPKVFSGAHVHHPAVRVLRGRELRVDADRPFTVYADGDPIGETPVTIRVVPHAVRVLVPAP
jgi:YegS/Rv2252/BmrU family lipid kinase